MTAENSCTFNHFCCILNTYMIKHFMRLTLTVHFGCGSENIFSDANIITPAYNKGESLVIAQRKNEISLICMTT